ncbi:hypothetical protein [Sporomusa malonica]|uniref:Outer membrane protein beta-barrel domain-containing protein n=1 Tax=Sporomusa malonica TaxID=112901 RepID=A0A1W2CZ01_9FIRM|nr:hypothetical protein [Sporomusa malonica]SMC90062.1 hypothetical protein SAMN04488500_11295 [Sporomusa malonica]
MKKSLLILGAFITLSTSTSFAAPLNSLNNEQTAIGLSGDTVYIEHKFGDRFTLGYQSIDRDNYGDMKDIYGQYQFSNNLRGIIGNRDFDYSDSSMYLGLGLQGSLAPKLDGFASFVAGDEFNELQVGAGYQLAANVDLNVTYTNFMPDQGKDKDEIAVGATFKF